MVKLPRTILKELAMTNNVTMETWIRHFMFEGYGKAKAKYWYREYEDLGWVETGSDGILRFPLFCRDTGEFVIDLSKTVRHGWTRNAHLLLMRLSDAVVHPSVMLGVLRLPD